MKIVSIILAAGKGTRMSSDVPKVLHPLLGAPLLEHVLRTSRAALDGVEQHQVVVVGYGREAIEAAFEQEQVTWAVQEPQLGTGHAASVGLEACREKISDDAALLILNGDLPLLRVDTVRGLVARFERDQADLALLTCDKEDPSGYGRIVRDGSGRFAGIVEERDADDATRASREINVGTYLIRAAVFDEFYAQLDRENAQDEFYLTDVVSKAAAAGRRVATHEVSDTAEIAQVNSRVELAAAAAILRERLATAYMEAGVTIVDPATTYIEVDVQIGRDTTIHPMTHIERGVEIGPRCQIGPFCHLRPGTELAAAVKVGNFVEIKKSTVGEGSKVPHLTYVGDAAVGDGVNIGAGTIFANYDGKTKSATTVRDRAFIGSGTILVAPVVVGEAAATGAGAVVLRGRDVADGGVVVGVPARAIKPAPETEAAPSRAHDKSAE